uniref:Mitochondrial import inner membrane translocase subunit Tim21 n=1 Tax=Latimeria chalumnae TaxID=7897 RepID=H3B9K9_LATCH
CICATRVAQCSWKLQRLACRNYPSRSFAKALNQSFGGLTVSSSISRAHFNHKTAARHIPKSCISLGTRLPSKQSGRTGDSTKSQVSVQRSPGAVSTAKKVKDAGRDFVYFMVVLVGIGVTGGLFYVIFKELFSSSSPSKIYGEALEKCRIHPEVIGMFGEPIKGYGETTRRGRRRHVSHMEYMKDGLKHMRLKFYIEGSEPRLQGTVHLEVKENPNSGKYEFRYIFVDVDTYPKRTIIIEDNR